MPNVDSSLPCRAKIRSWTGIRVELLFDVGYVAECFPRNVHYISSVIEGMYLL